MKAKKKTVRHIVVLSLFAVLLGGMIFGNYMCYVHATEITSHLVGSGIIIDSDKAQGALAEGDELVGKIADEGIVLLKNKDGALPVEVPENGYNINLFGVGSTADGATYSGVGSGASTIISEDVLKPDGSVKFKANRISLVEGLESSGFKVNKALLEKFAKGNPSASFYSSGDSALTEAKSFSRTAVVSISRVTGENVSDSELYIPTNEGNGLKINAEETAMLDYVKENYDKVIVIINSTNIMESGFLDDDKIHAALNVGTYGQSGTKAVGRILSGKVNPSGHLADTVPYDSVNYAPSFVNANRTYGSDKQITYAEDIYVGYKWYETADSVGFFDKVNNSYGSGYKGVVQYPFGYGLSYTDFTWSLEKAVLGVAGVEQSDKTLQSPKTTVALSVRVENTGNKAGKDVVQVYYSAPYYKGEIEKSYINLVAFGKTDIIEPGKSETLNMTFDIYDMASYDCYDKNGNGFNGWELDPGDYNIKIMKDAHTPSEIKDVTLTVPDAGVGEGRRGFTYRNDPYSNKSVRNRFTGATAEAGVPTDGSTLGDTPIKWLSRADFAGTFPYYGGKFNGSLPAGRTPNRPVSKTLADARKWYYTGYDENEKLQAPEHSRTSGEMLYLYTREDGSKATENDLNGKGATLKANEELIMELGSNYESEKWKILLSQLKPEEMSLICGSAGFGTKSAESIGKPAFLDFDGPSGFNSKITNSGDSTMWTAFPGEAVVACTWSMSLSEQIGLALGNEAKVTGGMSGIYAPTVNLHRTPYNTRNYEAYSEDGVLSGYMAAALIKGAKNHGLTCYLKHLALSELGRNPNDTDTWITEQNLRENYLKAFEIAVKHGGANGVMSAFNNVGAVRSCNNYALLTKILREEWGFRGVVITDYNMGTTREHVRAGNDLHLDPNESGGKWLNANDKAELYTAQQAVKNAVYSYCNSYYSAKTYNPEADMNLARREDLFAWWVVLLVLVDVLAVLGMAWYILRMFVTRKQIGCFFKKIFGEKAAAAAYGTEQTEQTVSAEIRGAEEDKSKQVSEEDRNA